MCIIIIKDACIGIPVHIFTYSIHSFDCQAELLSCSPWLVSGWHQWGYWYIILIVHVIMTSVRNYFLFPLDFSENDCKLLHAYAFLYIVTRVPPPYPKSNKRGVCNVICCLKTIAYSFVGYPDLIFMIRCCS